MNILPLKLSNSEHNKKQVRNILPKTCFMTRAFNLLTSNFQDCDSMWIKTISTSMELLFQGTGNVCGHGHRQEHGLVGFQGQLRGYFRWNKKCSFFRKWTNLLNVFQAVANDVNQNAMQKSSSSKKGSKRSQMEQETNQVLPSSTGQNFWVIGG